MATRPTPDVAEPAVAAVDLPRDIEYPHAPFLGPRVIEEIALQSVIPSVNGVSLPVDGGDRIVQLRGAGCQNFARLLNDLNRPLNVQ